MIFLVFVIAMAYSISAQSQANSEMQELFGDNDEAGVIVVLKDDYDVLQKYGISNDKDDFDAKKSMIKEQQGAVFADLTLKKKDKGLSAQNNEDYEFDLTNTYTTVNGFAGKLKKSGYQKLKNNPRVLKIYKPKNITLFLSDSAGIINATRTWSLVYNGTNVTGKHESVCVIDTGVDYTHPAWGECSNNSFLNGTCSKVIGGYDFVNSDSNPIDDNGHGTHVAGIVASTNETYRGIAPDANIIAIKVLDSSGGGSGPDLIDGIDWCVNNASKFNISVITMSLGTTELFASHCDNDDTLLTSSIANAIIKNISVIAATGNRKSPTDSTPSTTGIASPACITNTTAVGGTTKSDAIDFNRNNITDLLAPGVNITSTKKGGGFESLSGTSMATPHVAGAFALLRQYRRLEQNKVLTPAQIQDALNDTGKQIDDTSGSGFFFSRINIFKALLSLDTTAPELSLVAPTPANNTALSSTSFIINLTSSEVLSAVILEFNSSNETINATPILLNWMINKSVSSFGVFKYRIYGSDSAGNTQITPTFTVTINNTAPNITSFFPIELDKSINEPDNFTFNITVNDREGDAITTSWYQNGTLKSTLSNFTFSGNFSAVGFYNITVIVSDGSLQSSLSWNLTVDNTNVAPLVTSANLTNTDFLNRTNGTLQAFWSFSDFDNDSITANETLWYINNTPITNYTNQTFIHAINTTKLENWTFSVRVFDGFNWSDFMNSSKITILNGKPTINISTTSIELSETQKVNISLNANDLDNDILDYSINDSRFSREGNSFVWNTNLSDAGFYKVNVTANDSFDVDSLVINITINGARDLDNDGNPDFSDTDDDNDGISDENDFLVGNLSSINTTLSLSIAINGTSNLSKLFNGTFTINITNGTDTIMEFNFTFNSSNILDFGNLTINKTTNGSSAVSIRGNINLLGFKKTIFLEKINTTAKSVCIKDADAGFESISSACDSANETLVVCDNTTSGQYACFDTGSRYKITGLSHSAVKEQCRDADGDGYGEGCALGTDNCDNNPSQHTNDGCNPPSSSSSSGGGSSGGGGGGGSGGGLTFVCNMDWKCGEWNNCVNELQARQCDFVKVPQHVQETECPSSSSPPAITQKCEMPKQLALAAETCSDNIKNQNEQEVDCGGVCNPCKEKNLTIAASAGKEKETNQLTGFSIKDFAGEGSIFIAAGLIAVITTVFVAFKFYRLKQQ